MEWEKLEIIESFLRKQFPAAGIILCNSFHVPYFKVQVGSRILVLTVSPDFLQQVPTEAITEKLGRWGVVGTLEKSRGAGVILTSQGIEIADSGPELSA